MTPDLAAAVAEVERERGRQYVVAGPSWPEHLPRSLPPSLDLIEADGTPEPEPDVPHGTPCGWGGLPRCPRRLERRGLCNEHRATIRAIAHGWQPARRQPKGVGKPKAPPAQTINAADVFDAGCRVRVPAEERAAHLDVGSVALAPPSVAQTPAGSPGSIR